MEQNQLSEQILPGPHIVSLDIQKGDSNYSPKQRHEKERLHLLMPLILKKYSESILKIKAKHQMKIKITVLLQLKDSKEPFLKHRIFEKLPKNRELFLKQLIFY